MARVVIADAGPLIALACIDELDVLRRLFSKAYLTESVKDECLAKPGEDARRIEAAVKDGWLVVKPGGRCSQPLFPSLGIGESDSIRLAREDPENSLLVMDDRLARRYALRQGLSIIGTVRLLDLAERHGFIESSGRCIDDMAGYGYRVSTDLLKTIRS